MQKTFVTHPRRLLRSASILAAALITAPLVAQTTPPADIALAVVYDTSGSMRGQVQTPKGALPKHLVAQNAFAAVLDRLERFTTPPADGQPAKSLDFGIVVFNGERPQQALPLSRFNPVLARRWLSSLTAPQSSTPLGDAMLMAGRTLQKTSTPSKHLLVLTDGENTTGRTPLAALETLRRETADGQPVFVHVIAFDISPTVFASLQKAGANLVGAADEKELQTRLDFILETQILVEAP